MKKKPSAPIKGNFSDDAKRKAGVKVTSYAEELARLKKDHACIRAALNERVGELQECARLALLAFTEGRRGDGMKILNKMAPRGSAPPPPSHPTEPRTA